DMQQAIQIMENRVNASGTTEAQVQQQGSDIINVSVPGQSAQQVVNLVSQTAELQFRQVLLAAPVFGAASSTWRNCSSAVWLTRLTTCCALWPGTETLMMSLPCCWTWASVVPLAFTRFSMIWMACCMSDAVGGRPPGLTARSSTVVPLVRSSPRCTRKFLDQLPGVARSLPRMASNSTTMSAASTASARPGREALLLGGATSRPSFDSHAGEPTGRRRPAVR